MRIAIDGRAWFQRTGIARYTRGLVTALAAQASAHEFLLLISDWHRPEEVRLPGHVQVKVSKAPWLGGGTERTQLAREARGWGADLFHSLCPPIAVPGMRSVVTMFDLISLTHPHLHTPHAVRNFRSTVSRAIDRAAHIVAISSATGDAVRARYPTASDRISVVPCGVDWPSWPRRARDRARGRPRTAARRRRGMLYVGTIEPRKNVPLIVAAARQLHASGHRIPLTIVGKQGWGGYDVERDIAGLPGVRYRGYVSDRTLQRLYRESAVFVYPSLVEGFGLPAVEAMAYGALPIVSSDPALCEVVGDPDLVLPRTTPDAIAEAVLRWSRPSTCRTGKRRFLARRAGTFTWDRAARSVMRIYGQLA